MIRLHIQHYQYPLFKSHVLTESISSSKARKQTSGKLNSGLIIYAKRVGRLILIEARRKNKIPNSHRVLKLKYLHPTPVQIIKVNSK